MHQRSFMMLTGLATVAAIASITIALSGGLSSRAQAQGSTCVSACRAAHNECRIRTKGSSSCDAQFQACMRACVKR